MSLSRDEVFSYSTFVNELEPFDPWNYVRPKARRTFGPFCQTCGKGLNRKTDYSLLCGHLNCKNCLSDALRNAYMDTTLDNVKCLHPKCDEQVHWKSVEELRYLELSSDQILSGYESVLFSLNVPQGIYSIRCPACNRPVPVERSGVISTCLLCATYVCGCCKQFSFRVEKACVNQFKLDAKH